VNARLWQTFARLYDGGTTDDGAPYIIMEYIDGAPITGWADSQTLDLKDRLGLFNDTCRAVAFAHQNLIVHRDITPNNILVQSDGTAKLIDFGISHPIENEPSGDNQDEISSRSFTPGFAAPERVGGAAGTTLSDIYSLGKLLETLVNNSHVSDDLQAIISKATQNSPADRYSSVDALIDDLDRLTTHYPVAARTGNTVYSLGKFIRRQRLAVTLGSLVLLSLIGGLVTTSLMYQQAESARAEAEVATADADNRFNEVRELANFMLFDLYDDLSIVPGNTKSLSSIADKSKTYLDALGQDVRVTDELKLESAIGYKRLADVMGNPTKATLGRRKEAKILYLEAVDKLEALRVQKPDDADILRALGEATYDLAIFEFIAEDDNRKAIDYAQQSIRHYDTIMKNNDAELEDQIALVHAKKMAAIPLTWIGRGREGIDAMKLAQADILDILARHPDNLEVIYASGSIHVELARAITRHDDATVGDLEESVLLWNYSISSRQRTLELNPGDAKALQSLIKLYIGRGNNHMQRENYDLALVDMKYAEEITRDLMAKDPDDIGLIRSLGSTLFETARVLSFSGQHKEALASGLESLEMTEQLLAGEPNNPGRLRELAHDQGIVGEIMRDAYRPNGACALLRKAKASWETYAETTAISEFDQTNNVGPLDENLKTCL